MDNKLKFKKLKKKTNKKIQYEIEENDSLNFCLFVNTYRFCILYS